tara:strand:- start:2637 stop:2975 length:339 start_codon:yes stop_codon:yes gene_type:complete
MTILKKVEDLYSNLGQNMCQDIAMYLEHEYVVKTPNSLIMGKAVRTEDGDPNDQWNVVAPDAWFVKTAVGEDHIGHFINCMPYPLPFVGWMRELKNRPVKWYKLEQILRRKI